MTWSNPAVGTNKHFIIWTLPKQNKPFQRSWLQHARLSTAAPTGCCKMLLDSIKYTAAAKENPVTAAICLLLYECQTSMCWAYKKTEENNTEQAQHRVWRLDPWKETKRQNITYTCEDKKKLRRKRKQNKAKLFLCCHKIKSCHKI